MIFLSRSYSTRSAKSIDSRFKRQMKRFAAGIFDYLSTPSFSKRLLFFLGADLVLFFVSLHLAYALRFDFAIPPEFISRFYSVFFPLAFLKITALYLFGIYRLTWRFFSFHDAKKLFLAHLLALMLFFIAFWIEPAYFNPMPRSTVIIDLFLSFFLVGGLRFSKRVLIESSRRSARIPTLLVGISDNTANLITTLSKNSSHYRPVAIAAIQERNLNLVGSTVQNLTVINPDRIDETVARHTVSAGIIDGSIPNESLKEAYRLLADAGISNIKRSLLLADGEETIAPLSIEELLARHPKDLDTAAIGHFIRGKRVLITGAGGSIGSEIALQCHRFGAAKLLLIDNSEYNLYRIGETLPDAVLRLCDITDRNAFDAIIDKEPIDLIVHAAAYKHVPLCEENIRSAIENNVFGSRNVIDSAIAHNVPKIVIISTDKAVRPTNVMGATKRIVELYAQNVESKTSEIVSVRFGNVLGSSGSVIPKFKSQIESGGPVTITHPDITRYFMLIGEACQLVLQAAAIARGGELFILDMGEPVKIIDLARTMIRLYATRPIEIAITGLRPGEKLYEELLLDESEKQTAYDSILIAGSTPYDIIRLNRDIDLLLETQDPISALHAIVPEFLHEPRHRA